MRTSPALFLLFLASAVLAPSEVSAGSVKVPEVDLAPKPLIAPDPWVPEVTGIAVCADPWCWALRRSFPQGRTYRGNAVRRLERAWQDSRTTRPEARAQRAESEIRR